MPQPSRARLTCLLSLLLLARPAAAGVTLAAGNDLSVTLDLLVTPQVNLVLERQTVPSPTLRYEPYIRHVRIMMGGRITSQLGFFLSTDAGNLGLGGAWAVPVAPLDAFVEWTVHPAFVVDAGLVLPPFSHHQMQGAATLLGVDYAFVPLVQEPTLVSQVTGERFPSNATSRDVGLMVRGIVLEDRLEYRLAATSGVVKQVGGSSLNLHAVPRLTGRLTYNFFDSEAAAGSGIAGYFYNGLALEPTQDRLLTTRRVLSLGGSASWQPSAMLRGSGSVDYQAYAVDAFLDLPLFDRTHSLNAQAALTYYRSTGPDNAQPGRGLFAEVGYRIGRFEPLMAAELLVFEGLAGDTSYYRGGANFWALGHRGSIKLDAGARRSGTDPFGFIARAQTQIFF